MADSYEPGSQQMCLDLGLGDETEVYPIDETDEHGEVFTRRWVVELILDLAGFTADRDLGGLVAVEPSCGAGAFLVPMTERLIESCSRHGRPLSDIAGASSRTTSFRQRRTRSEGCREGPHRCRRATTPKPLSSLRRAFAAETSC